MILRYDTPNKTVWMFATHEEVANLAVQLKSRAINASADESLTVLSQDIDNSEMCLRVALDPDKPRLDALKQAFDQAFFNFAADQTIENQEKMREAGQRLLAAFESNRPKHST